MDRTMFLTIAYDGEPFAGFQSQPNQVTVQGRVEDALGTALRREVRTIGAGRTDAGVHALGQVVSFPVLGDEPEAYELIRSVNALAGPFISVSEARFAVAGADARHSAIRREYSYRVVAGSVPPVFLSKYVWWVKPDLDEEAMRRAAACLVGEHDFASFCVSETARTKPTVRSIDRLEVSRTVELGEEAIMFTVTGRAFLHSMVRIIVGSLVEVGKGARSGEWLSAALSARDRAEAGPTAPAHGLVLAHVEYPDDIWV